MKKETNKEFFSDEKDAVATLANDFVKTHTTGDLVFDEKHVLHELKHYLPSQTPLKDFIHHNSLHAFQKMKFYDGIFTASKIFGYQVTLQLSEYRELYRLGRIRKPILEKVIADRKGIGSLEKWKENVLSKEYDTANVHRIGSLRSHWKSRYKMDLDASVHPLLFRILCSYLDQGISIWKFPSTGNGFLSSMKELEKNSLTGFFRTKKARRLLLESDCKITDLLKVVVGNEAYYSQYLFDQQFAHQGWSGMVSAVEDQPQSLLDHRVITLHDLVVFELLLEIDALDDQLGKDWLPLADHLLNEPAELFADVPQTEITEVFTIWQDAFEWSYYDEVLSGLAATKKMGHVVPNRKSFQAMFCIDERECSLRRHIESTDPDCETFGWPGFFSVEFFFLPENGSFYDKLCPQPVTPKYLIKETEVKEERKHELFYTKLTHTFLIGYLVTLTFGVWSAIRLFLNLFRPKMNPAISNAFAHMTKGSRLSIENVDPSHRENDLQIGFTVEEMAARVEGLLRGIGLLKGFAPVIYVIAHGSSSANNPHHGAHDCGACSGRPGSVNSRVFAFMANHPGVRKMLSSRGIVIPVETQFVGGLHDTASDEIAFYDYDILTQTNAAGHTKNSIAFERALDLNAKERSRRFFSIDTKMGIKKIREAIRQRSVSLFEPRPELGHGTNTLCIVGSRNLTKGLFLDRRAFLNSYDYRTDPEGKILVGVMKPLGPVCGGINLEYYFSRVDNHKL
ncbi:MAG: putative inorganic carbon transporter subunit DabA, partial [Chitinophagaceae bacterium]